MHGHLFQPLDADSAAEAIHRAIAQFPTTPDGSATRVRITRSRAEQHAWSKVVDELVDTMRKALSHHRSRDTNYNSKKAGAVSGTRETALQLMALGIPICVALANDFGVARLAPMYTLVGLGLD